MKKHKLNYSNNINLPNTNFPMKANLTINEPKILKMWLKKKIYDKLKTLTKNNKKFIIHDGPPYANGNIHLGHALNKILKDITLKYKIFKQYNIYYKIGWDCHGLPIELNIKKKFTSKLNSLYKIIKFKNACLKYVIKQINLQKQQFINLGIITNWKNYYNTMDFKNIASTINIFSKFYKKKLIKRIKKPIYWCIKCKSSLAEAEINYNYTLIKSIYVIFNISNKNKFLKKININKLKNIKNIQLIIWTTTPWSIPANNAISIHKYYKYVLIKNNKNIIIIIKNTAKQFCKEINIPYYKIFTIKGHHLTNYNTYHPISKIKIPIIFNKYIKKNIGTGIVHLASHHGLEDNIICSKYNIKGHNIINKKGKFNNYKYIKNLYKKKLLKGQKLIIKKLNKNKKIINKKIINYKIPYCWRHKKPIIIRTTYQWFIIFNKNNLKKKLLNNIKKIKWIPKWGYNKIKKLIKNRPDWCISRQRHWGTPLPLFIHKKTFTTHPKTYKLLKYISKKIEKYGPNYWLKLKKKDIIKEYKDYKKIYDVLDIWFDSGATLYTIFKKNINNIITIDTILEGQDQYRGWFMSLLIINIIINKKFKFKKIISHGFVVDKNNIKMSKSLNNNINPLILINKYGADIIRLWVSSVKFYNNIKISNEIIQRNIETYRKIRNTFKFIINNLNKYNPKKNFIKIQNLIQLDQWIIYKLYKYQKKIIKLYNKFKYYKIIKIITYFCNYYLSSIYFDIIKDRKYIIKRYTYPVYSAQTTLYILLETMVKWIAPILSFTSEEIWKYIPRKKPISIYLDNKFYYINYLYINKKYINIWKILLKIKFKLNKIIDKYKKLNIIKSSLEIYVKLYLNIKYYKKIIIMKNELKYFFIISKIKIKKFKLINFKIKCKKINGIKCLRCWHFYKNNIKNFNNFCYRCYINIKKNGEIRKFI